MMKKNLLWMLAAILTCGLGMSLTSCIDNADNSGDASVQPEQPYTIVVGEGMTMPQNLFETETQFVDGNPAVVNALKAIDGVMDVKVFQISKGKDYYTNLPIEKNVYYFNFKQLVDHTDASKGWFKQQCLLSLAGDYGNNRPTVLHTEGYAMEGKNNHLSWKAEPMLVSVLNANCLQVEYRYHGWSLPEGWTNNFNYLTAKQHSDDLHAIVTAIKNSGIIDKSSKWASTGVSKNGMTTAHYAYYYPNEMDAYVPFCAPFLLSLRDLRPYTYIVNKQAFDEDEQKLEKVKNAFRAFVSDKAVQAACVPLYRRAKPEYAIYSDETLHNFLLAELFGNYYPKMSYVPYALWEPLIPQAGDTAEKFLAFILANDETKYDTEKKEDYDRRQETVDDLEPDDDLLFNPLAPRRAAAVARYDAYYVQTCIELGNYGYDLSWVEDLLTKDEITYLSSPFHNPSTYGVTYDGGKFIREFLEGMKQSTCNMMFVYGMQDPWTGGQIPDENLGPNSQKLFIQNGRHNDYVDQWNPSERAQLLQWLKGLGFDL